MEARGMLGIEARTREQVRELLDRRGQPSEEGPMFGAERVDIELTGAGNGPFRVRKGSFEFLVDEPPERGGTDAAPNPLAYFLGGAATCLLSHLALVAIAEDMPLDEVRLRARGRFERVMEGGRFTDVVYNLALESPEPRDRVTAAARRAETACYAHNTLADAGVRLTTHVELGGEEIASLERNGGARSIREARV